MVSSKRDISQASAELQNSLSRLDVDTVGIVSLKDGKDTTLEEIALRLLPSARSVVIFAMEVYPEILAMATTEQITGAPVMNDLLARNADFLGSRLTKAAYDVTKAAHRLGTKALPLPAVGCPFDARFLKGIFSFKHAAQAARMGKIGWSSLLITPNFGPRVRLSCCLTEAELETTNSTKMTLECSSCSICLDNCPAKALSRPKADEPYAINKFACSLFRTASGGCSECMRLCPIGS